VWSAVELLQREAGIKMLVVPQGAWRAVAFSAGGDGGKNSTLAEDAVSAHV